MTRRDLPYLWRAEKRRGAKVYVYWFYRRAGRRLPVVGPDGRRLTPDDPGFLAAYERLHAGFGATPADPTAVATGSLGHVVAHYLDSPEFRQLAAKTRRDYRRYLERLRTDFGALPLATMPPDFVLALRDRHADTPRAANYLVTVLGRICHYARKRPKTFLLPPAWQNPASAPGRLRTGPGHRPWLDWEIAAFRARWSPQTVERVGFELALATGQRGGDIVAMDRRHLTRGRIAVAQHKGGERLVIPASQALLDVLTPWLAAHDHMLMITADGRPFTSDHFGKRMRRAYRAAALPPDVTTHGLRLTAGTIVYELTGDWRIVGAILGHRTEAMTRHYIRQSRDAETAIARLDEHRK